MKQFSLLVTILSITGIVFPTLAANAQLQAITTGQNQLGQTSAVQSPTLSQMGVQSNQAQALPEAQVQQAVQGTVLNTQTAITPEVNQNRPELVYIFSSVGLFFRDLSQRIQLIVAVRDTSDATLRLKFAQDNVELVRQMMTYSANERTVNQAQELAERATDLVTTVNARAEDWSKGDPEALNALNKQADLYFESAGKLLAEVYELPEAHSWDGFLDGIHDNLALQNEKTKVFLQTALKTNVQNNNSIFLENSNEVVLENDKDVDGIEDNDEKALGLSASDFDTDRDGISDSVELERFGTDPTKADTDGDGYRDGLEILKGFNPIGEGDFSTTTLKNEGFVFVKAKMTMPNLSPTTIKFLQDASQGKKLERYNGN